MAEDAGKYRINWGVKGLMILLIPLSIIALKISSGLNHLFFMVATPFLIMACIGSLFAHDKIDDEGAEAMIGPFVIKKIRWEDVKFIYDDRFLFVHNFIFKGANPDRKKDYAYGNLSTNYKSFLYEAITRVRPDTEVESKILHLADLTHSDIGKQYRQHQGQPSTID